MSRRLAAFLDRDGTIIEDVHYIANSDDVRVRSGAAEAIAALNDAGVAVVVITNQSGIARGLLTVADYERVRDRVDELLAARGARIDGTYYCPHHPDITGECACRKPGTLLFDEAIADLDIDASESLFAGDRLRDVIPARTYGGVAFLVRGPSTPATDVDGAPAVGADVVDSLGEAVQRFLVKAGRVR